MSVEQQKEQAQLMVKNLRDVVEIFEKVLQPPEQKDDSDDQM